MNNQNFLGLFISTSIGDWNTVEKDKVKYQEYGENFNKMIILPNGFRDTIHKIPKLKYGNDIKFILISIYLNPIQYLINSIKEVDNYSKKNKDIEINIIVNETNFFNLDESDKLPFLYNELLLKLEKLKPIIKKKNLDTNIDLLIEDFKNIIPK